MHGEARIVTNSVTMLEALGGEDGCRQLSATFYARVSKDPVLKRLFPGKSVRCATEEFAAYLIQFLGGDEVQTQKRWWLSLGESHARFRIGPEERAAWLAHMAATLDEMPLGELARSGLKQFFVQTSGYVASGSEAKPEQEELSTRWQEQRVLDAAIAAIAARRCDEAIALAQRFVPRTTVFVGLLARMLKSAEPELIRFVVDAVESNTLLTSSRFSGRTLLHFAAGAGSVEVVKTLLQLGADVDALQTTGHTPLYCVANECGTEAGPMIVRALAKAGANVNDCGGVTRATPLHMAARRGFVATAETLLDCGAAIGARDKKGDTPLQRAMNCRQDALVRLLKDRGSRSSR